MHICRRRFALTALSGLLLLSGCGDKRSADPRIEKDGTVLKVNLDSIGPKGGAFFSYFTSADRRVDFFVYRESDGTYRAALDACRKCYRWRKGYRLEKGSVVCRKCGETFTIDSLHEGRGSCVPIPLTSKLDGNALAIPIAELEDGARYF